MKCKLKTVVIIAFDGIAVGASHHCPQCPVTVLHVGGWVGEGVRVGGWVDEGVHVGG